MGHLSKELLLVSNLINDSANLIHSLGERNNIIVSIAMEIAEAFKRGNKLLICGNGGSAADAQHIAGEFTGKFKLIRDPLPAIAITTNTSILTAIANDDSYDEIFSRQVMALTNTGDVVLGISTSGNSINIIKAIEKASELGAVTIAFTGNQGKLRDVAKLCLDMPSNDTPRIQEAHIVAAHIICHLVEESVFLTRGL